jgi:hypothetical protein
LASTTEEFSRSIPPSAWQSRVRPHGPVFIMHRGCSGRGPGKCVLAETFGERWISTLIG